MSNHDPTICPLCGRPNNCGLAEGHNRCWCFEVEISETARQRALELVGERICICQDCARERSSAEELADTLERIKKHR